MDPGNLNNKDSENNQVFDNILRDVIHVTAGEQRTNVNLDSSTVQIQEIPSAIKGLNEPKKNLVDFTNLGVFAPISVLSAQPPSLNDVKLISNFAQEANACINNYTVIIPTNVSFNFNQIA